MANAIVPVEIDDRILASLIESMPRGADYWSEGWRVIDGGPLNGGCLALFESVNDQRTPHRLDFRALVFGLRLMSARRPKSFGKLLAGDGDMNTADLLAQFSVLGEERYG